MLRAFFLFCLFVTCCAAEDVSYFSPMVAYGNASGILGGHVNVVTGDFVDYACDLVIPGPLPLTVERSYASSVYKQYLSPYHSWHFNYDSKGLVDLGESRVEDKRTGKKKYYEACKVTFTSTCRSQNVYLAEIKSGKKYKAPFL